MKHNGWLLLIGIALFVAVCEVIFHWLLVRGAFPSLLAFYLYEDPQSKKDAFRWDIVNTFPAAALGIANGWIGYPRWSARVLCATTLVLAVYVAAMMRAYGLLVRHPQFATSWIYNICTAFAVTGFFTFGAYVFRRDRKRRG